VETSLDGARTLSCVHCDERFMVMPSITDEDVVLLGVLAAHLLVRHAPYFQTAPIPNVAEVLQHFRVRATDNPGPSSSLTTAEPRTRR
jgi:hypothetical protein